MAHNPEQDKASESHKNDDLLQDYFNEMLGFDAPEPKPEPESAPEPEPAIAQAAAPKQEAPPEPDSVPESSAEEQTADSKATATDDLPESAVDQDEHSEPDAIEEPRSRIMRSAQDAAVPNLAVAKESKKTPRERPYKTEPSPTAVIPSLMPKLKTAPLEKTEAKVETQAKVDVPETKKTFAKPAVVEQTKQQVEQKLDTKTEVQEQTKVAEPQVKAQVEESSELSEPEAITVAHSGADQGVPPKTPGVPSFRDMDAFEALLFEVRGLQLAVPLVSLGSIHKIDKEFTPIVGRADWFLGLFRANDRNLQIVDTARWVMPGRAFDSDESDYAFVIRLGDSDWGLACNSVNQSVRIAKDEIKWRTSSSRRPWLAGTVINKMCALLDVENMATLLDSDKLQSS